MKKTVPTVIVALVLLSPAIALAGPSGDVAATGNFLVEVLKPIVVGAAAWLGGKLAQWIGRKTKVDVGKQIDQVLDLAIGYADQMAKKVLAHGAVMKGEQKLALAKTWAKKLATKYKIPKWALDEIEDLIEARIGAVKRKARDLSIEVSGEIEGIDK